MEPQDDQEGSPELADRVESALKAFWQGDTTQMEQLVGVSDSAAPRMGELLGSLASPAGPAAAPPLPADAIPGYAILREIARGGMGVVYEALQEGTNRNVALKVMLAGAFASPAGQARFQREVELAARLEHPNIARILEGKRLPGGLPYYAMDYVRGVPLDRYLATAHCWTAEIIRLFIHLCRAVHYAHEHGVIHRDLKPGNVLVDPEGQPHIVDFGLAKTLDAVQPDTLAASVSSPDQIAGTLRYMSPEQAAGKLEAVDRRTDVYTLGVMLFEALTGAMPYDTSGHPSSALQRIVSDPPVRPSSLAPDLDRDLDTIILRALEKEPDRRFPSAAEPGDDLQRLLNGEPIRARPPSRLYVVRKKLAKHRWRVAVGTAALVLTLVGVSVGLRARRRLHESQAGRTSLDIERSLRLGNYTEAAEACRPLLTDPQVAHMATLQRGYAYLCLGDYALAIENYTVVIESSGQGLEWAYYQRATAQWIAGRGEEAVADYRAFLRLRPDHQYAAARLFLVLCDQARALEKNGQAEHVQRILQEAEGGLAQARARAAPGSWISDIFACLAGELPPQELVARASGGGERLCEAYYYAGEASLLARQPDEACRWFEECVRTDLRFDPDAAGPAPMSEWHLARWRWEDLCGDAVPTTAPAGNE